MLPSDTISNILTHKKSKQKLNKSLDKQFISEEQNNQDEQIDLIVDDQNSLNSNLKFNQSLVQNLSTNCKNLYLPQDESKNEQIIPPPESLEKQQIDQYEYESEKNISVNKQLDVKFDLENYLQQNQEIVSLLQQKQYEIKELIYEGEISFVFKANNSQTQEEVAIKIINFQKFNYPHIKKLIEALNENILQFKEKYQKNSLLKYIIDIKEQFIQDNIYIQIMELCQFNFNSCSLQSYFSKINKNMKYPHKINYILACSLNELHEQNLTHLNLKPSNILINKSGYIKLSDFIACTAYYQQLQKFLMYLKYKKDYKTNYQHLDSLKNLDVFNLGYVMDRVLQNYLIKIDSFKFKDNDFLQVNNLIQDFIFSNNLEDRINVREIKNILQKIIKKINFGIIGNFNFDFDEILSLQTLIELNIVEFKNQTKIYTIQSLNNKQRQHFDLMKNLEKKIAMIVKEINQRNYFTKNILTIGGEGVIFEGAKNCNIDDQISENELIIKVQFNEDNEQQNQIFQILMSFNKYDYNIVNLIDFFVQPELQVLVLEKCKMSLQQELQIIQNGQAFFEEIKLLNMIFDLLDGLIILQQYNIIHSDIKPCNILINQNGHYVYTDFGISQIVLNYENKKSHGYTPNYAAPEQKSGQYISFKTDVYSLGKTFKSIIQIYEKKCGKQLPSYIANFQNIIDTHMIKDDCKERKSCLELHEMFFQHVKEEKQFLDLYLAKLKKLKFLQISLKNTQFYQQYIYYSQIFIENSQDKCVLEKLEQLLDFFIIQGEYEQSVIQQNKIFQYIQYKYSDQQNKLTSYCLFIQNKPTVYPQLNLMLEYFQNQMTNFSDQSDSQNQQYYTNYNNLGFVLYHMGEYRQAIANLKKSLKIQNLSSNIDSQLDQAITQFNVAFCQAQLKNYKAAKKYCLKFISFLKENITQHNPYFVPFQSLMAVTYYNLKDYSNALKNFEILLKVIQELNYKMLNEQENIVGKQHTDIADLYQQTATCYFLQKQYLKAIILADQAYQIYQSNENNSINLCSLKKFIFKCIELIEQTGKKQITFKIDIPMLSEQQDVKQIIQKYQYIKEKDNQFEVQQNQYQQFTQMINSKLKLNTFRNPFNLNLNLNQLEEYLKFKQ